MSNFTKGEWEIYGDWGIKAKGAKDCLATFETQISDKGENEGFANAHLMASAPAMYAMLEDMFKNHEMGEGVDADIYELLKKARGE